MDDRYNFGCILCRMERRRFVDILLRDDDVVRELEPLRSLLTLKTLSGDLITLEIDYANIHRTPYQQLKLFMREYGVVGECVVFDNEGTVKNFESDIFPCHSTMNVFVN